MTTTDSLSRFHTFMAVYESCRASALGSALQMTPMAARALGLICAFPGMTLHELSCILGGSQGQVIGAAFDLHHLGYIERIEERNDEGRRVLQPIRERMFGFDGYHRLVNNLAAEAGLAYQLEALLPKFQTVLIKALEELQGDAQSRSASGTTPDFGACRLINANDLRGHRRHLYADRGLMWNSKNCSKESRGRK